MPIQFLMDTHIPRSITLGLRTRGVDVLTTQEDNSAALPHRELIKRATESNRVLFTFDRDFLKIVSECLKRNESFSGLVYAKPLRISIGKIIEDLELIAKVAEPKELVNLLVFLPL